MTNQSRRQQSRKSDLESSNLVPVTMRMTVHDRDLIERSARLGGSSLSEWLRDIIDDHKLGARIDQRINQLEAHMREISNDLVNDRQAFANLFQKLDLQLTAIDDRMGTTSESVGQFTSLIQTSFEQLFQAFFQLQKYIEHLLKQQGGR